MFSELTHTIQGWFWFAAPTAHGIAVQPERQETRRSRCRQAPLSGRAVTFLAAAALPLLWMLAGCAQPSSVPALIPSTGGAAASSPGLSGGAVEVREYALVEQSKDNPTHLAFQERVPAAVAAQRGGWALPGLEEALAQPNRALADFGFRLQANQSPPFGGYTLYHHGAALQSDIAGFWQVSLKYDPDLESRDFLLPFVTLAGEKLVASASGIYPWNARTGAESSALTYYGEAVAYAQSTGGKASVYAGPSLLYPESEPQANNPRAPSDGARALITWGGPQANQHWALEQDGRVVVDGEDLAARHQAERVYEFRVLDGRPLYFYDKDGLTFMNFDGRDLHYNYDQVVYQNSGDLSVFNPGASGRVMWFYALRDGLWYYVEAGIFD